MPRLADRPATPRPTGGAISCSATAPTCSTRHGTWRPVDAIRARLSTKAGTYCWFLEVAYANGCLGQLDLHVAVRMDWWEGFQVYGCEGSVVGKLFNPWYLSAAEVQAFSIKDDQFHQPIGEDANVFRLQVEDFVAAATTGATPRGATAEDGLASVGAMVAFARSVTTGEWVELDDVAGELVMPTRNIRQDLRPARRRRVSAAVAEAGFAAVQFNLSVVGLSTVPTEPVPAG